MQSWAHGKQLTLVRNPNYWGSHTAYLDRIVIRFCREVCNAPQTDEVLDSLRQGRVHFAFSRDTTTASELRRISGVRVLAAATNGWEHFDISQAGHPALRSNSSAGRSSTASTEQQSSGDSSARSTPSIRSATARSS